MLFTICGKSATIYVATIRFDLRLRQCGAKYVTLRLRQRTLIAAVCFLSAERFSLEKVMQKQLNQLKNTQIYKNLLDDTRDKNFVTAFGVQPNEKPFIVAMCDRPVLYVCSDYVESQRVFRAVQSLCGDGALYLPHSEDVLLYKRTSSKNAVYTRNGALYRLLDGFDVAVTCVDSLLQLYPTVDKFRRDCFDIVKGVCYDSKMLARSLASCGYSRVDGISAEGEFAFHGDILDISMPFGKRFRVEFWDDEVDKVVSVAEDGSTSPADKFTVYPLYETNGLSADKLPLVAKLADKVKLSPDARARLSEILSELQISAASGTADGKWLQPFVKSSPLSDYLSKDTLVVWDEPKLLSSRVKFVTSEHAERVANLTKAGEVLPVHQNCLRTAAEAYDIQNKQLTLQTLPYGSDFFQPQAVHNLKTGAVPGYANAEDVLATDLKSWKQSGYMAVLLVSAEDVKFVSDRLAGQGVFLSADPTKDNADGLILPFAYERGFVSHSNKLAVIGARDLGRGVKQTTLRKSKRQAFLSVEKGDYVVHEIHGIGLCEGIQKIKVGDSERDYIVVLYKNGDRLYVPVDASDMLSRYSGGENPTLSRIGGEDFSKVKSKVKAGIKAMSIDLLKLYAEREKKRGFRYHIDNYLEEEFQQYFPYKATDDQIKCQKEIEADLMSDKIMDRVLVGDVGYGKTEVAMRAAFDVVSNGYQVAMLAPTTILAEQHYNSFRERMSHFDIKVACVNRFRTPDEQKKILDAAVQGNVDILIGTHRLLSKDVKFNKLGLLILDEEQRFGVEHKESIKAAKTNVDVLTLSATPIPRTLHMALSGIRDISTITTPPVERMAVETYVSEESDALLADVVRRELGRGGQVYVVYNRVETIDAFARKLSELVDEAKIVVGHGQMEEDALEQAVMKFAEGEFNVLVCTTIIENGIDIPNANTIVVMDADRLGLSQLYQLRGRVGRSNRLAYAYFLYKQDKVLSETAYKRLASVTEYSELGSGFKIAMKDLEIRGAGNILGREQHGHMMKVGYDMYARMLKETVAELRGTPVEEKLYTDVEIDIQAYAPESYIPSQTERMDFYQQLAACPTEEEIDKLQKQIADVYGALPGVVDNLFVVARLKLLANGAGISKVTVKCGKGELTFASREKMMRKEVFDAISDDVDRISPMSGGYGVKFVSADFMQKERLLAAMTDFLQKIQTK